MSLRNTRWIFSEKIIPPCINLNMSDNVQKLFKKFIVYHFIQSWNLNHSSFQVLENYWNPCSNFRGYQFEKWYIKRRYHGETIYLMRECVEGKHGKNWEELKVYIVTVQNIPNSLIPYFILVVHSKTINDSNYLGEFNINECIEAEKSFIMHCYYIIIPMVCPVRHNET